MIVSYLFNLLVKQPTSCECNDSTKIIMYITIMYFVCILLVYNVIFYNANKIRTQFENVKHKVAAPLICTTKTHTDITVCTIFVSTFIYYLRTHVNWISFSFIFSLHHSQYEYNRNKKQYLHSFCSSFATNLKYFCSTINLIYMYQ